LSYASVYILWCGIQLSFQSGFASERGICLTHGERQAAELSIGADRSWDGNALEQGLDPCEFQNGMPGPEFTCEFPGWKFVVSVCGRNRGRRRICGDSNWASGNRTSSSNWGGGFRFRMRMGKPPSVVGTGAESLRRAGEARAGGRPEFREQPDLAPNAARRASN
jgi:hypothetical protein